MFNEVLHPNGILELLIERPPVNAFSIDLLNSLSSRLESLDQDPGVRVVLIRSVGRGFCAGGDVKEVEGLAGHLGILGQASGSLRLSLALLRCAVPVVCGIHAYCVGVGVIAAASADILISSRSTRFVLAEVDNGATAGGALALRLMPEKRARAAMMTAEPILADELFALGSIFKLAANDEAVAQCALAVAAIVAGKSAETMRKLKASLNNSSKCEELLTLYRAELSYTYELNISGDAQAGRSAFINGTREGYPR